MKRPTKITICGRKFKVKSTAEGVGGSFDVGKAVIEVDWGSNYANEILFHEILEIILCMLDLRYANAKQYGNHGFLFAFDHGQLDLITQELSGVMKQLGINFEGGKQ